MNFAEEGASKRYCIRPKHVAIICATVVAVGLIVGLSVGLTRTCPPPPETEDRPTDPTTGPPQNVGACPASEEDGPWTAFRLPGFLTPEHYDLEVQPRLLEDTYSGTVNITLQLTQATSHLWLHLRETWISQLPRLRGSSGAQLAVKRCFEYRAQEFVVVEAAQVLQPGPYVLTLDFAGWLNGSLVGFYRTTYLENGQVK